MSEDDDAEEEEEESEPVVAVPPIPPTGDMDVHAVIQREDGGVASASNSGGGTSTTTGHGRGSASGASTPLVGARIRTPRQAQAAGIDGNLSELMHFTLMHAEAENQAEERKDIEDRCRRERGRRRQISSSARGSRREARSYNGKAAKQSV